MNSTDIRTYHLRKYNKQSYVHVKKKALVLPKDLTPAIKASNVKVLVSKGNHVVVPYDTMTFTSMRKSLAGVPPPILAYYNWPGGVKPFKAQYITSAMLSCTPRFYVLNDMGTGKTLASHWAYDWLRRNGLANKLLVISPLSTLERVWVDEIMQRLPHLHVDVVHGPSAKRKLILKNSKADVLVINHDGISIKEINKLLKDKILAKQITNIIVDEGATFRNSRTTRWKALHNLTNVCPSLWWMTGTPMPNGPMDVWAQARLVTPSRVPNYFTKWRDMVMRQAGPFRWVPRKEAEEWCKHALSPAVRFSIEECVDLPECIYETRQVPMTHEQSEAYRNMQVRLHAQLNGTAITAVNEGVKASKLLQILCGVVYDDDGKPALLDAKPRIDELKEIIQQSKGKVIVFAPFVAVVENLSKQIPGSMFIHGGVGKTERDRILKNFQTRTHSGKVLVAQPGTMSRGLTLVQANTIVWYGGIYSNETYLQANRRIYRSGQVRTCVVVHLTSSEFETKLYNRLKNKQKLQGLVLDAVHERVRK